MNRGVKQKRDRTGAIFSRRTEEVGKRGKILSDMSQDKKIKRVDCRDTSIPTLSNGQQIRKKEQKFRAFA